MNFSQRLRKLNAWLYPQHMFQDPEWVVLAVNNHCNLHCRWCDVGTGDHDTNFAHNLCGSAAENMDAELFCRICDELARSFPSTKLGLGFTEPLIYPFLEGGLTYASRKGIFTAVTTNGFELPSTVEALCNARCKQLFVSLDGTQEIHNRTRGHGQAFQRAIQGLESLFSHANAPEVSIFCLITTLNIEALFSFAEFLRPYPIKNLGFLHMNFITKEMAAVHNNLFGLSYHATHSNIHPGGAEEIDTRLLLHEIDKFKSTRFPFAVTFSPELHTQEDLEVYYHQPLRPIGTRCTDAITNLMIRTDGSVIPAHGRCYPCEFGNVNTSSLPQIWNSVKAIKFRKDLRRAGGLMPACSRCCSAFGG